MTHHSSKKRRRILFLASLVAATLLGYAVPASKRALSKVGGLTVPGQGRKTKSNAAKPEAVTMTATLADDITLANKKNPGDTITYTLNVTNSGTSDATGINFSDIVDSHTTLLAGSGVLAVDDAYNTIGNVNINVAAPGLLTNDRDITAGNNTGMTATGATVSSSQCAACKRDRRCDSQRSGDNREWYRAGCKLHDGIVDE